MRCAGIAGGTAGARSSMFSQSSIKKSAKRKNVSLRGKKKASNFQLSIFNEFSMLQFLKIED